MAFITLSHFRSASRYVSPRPITDKTRREYFVGKVGSEENHQSPLSRGVLRGVTGRERPGKMCGWEGVQE